tara:strand:- start:458 stop:814 length:357 start_codon:yes stop_codon:yes gene_type:complete
MEDANRIRLRERIRNKRNQRLGTDDAVKDDSDISSVLRIQDPATREQLSRRVEAELRKVFGSDPDAMNVAQNFINNPMSALDSSTRTLPHLSTEERVAVESLVKMSEGEDDEEAPPMQ